MKGNEFGDTPIPLDRFEPKNPEDDPSNSLPVIGIGPHGWIREGAKRQTEQIKESDTKDDEE